MGENKVPLSFVLQSPINFNFLITLPTKIMNKQSIIEIEKNFVWATLKTISWKTASQIPWRNCSREAWFSAQSCILSAQRTPNKSGVHSFLVSKKPDQHIHSESVWPRHLGRDLIIEGGSALVSQEDRYLIFIFNMDIRVITTPFSLTIKADVQYIYIWEATNRLFWL